MPSFSPYRAIFLLFFVALLGADCRAGHVPVFLSGGARTIMAGYDEDAHPIDLDGNVIEKKRFTLGKWGVDSSSDATPSQVTAEIEKPFIKINSVSLGVPLEYSYSFRIRLSGDCKPYGIIDAWDSRGNHFYTPFYFDRSGPDGPDAWNEVSVSARRSGMSALPSDYKFECYLFESGMEILTSETSPATLRIEEPSTGEHGDRPPSAVIEVRPMVPRDIVKKRQSVEAVIEFVITETGEVRAAKVLKTNNKKFGQQAKIAVESTRFYPGMKDGKPLAARVRLPSRYTPK